MQNILKIRGHLLVASMKKDKHNVKENNAEVKKEMLDAHIENGKEECL